MNIILYRGFRKRENSTKKPDNSVTSRTITGIMREPSSMISPIVNFKRVNFESASTAHEPSIFTYAYIPDFRRYYFIKDWIWNDGLWECHMVVDVLASYQEEIGGTTAYIERTSALQYVNGAIIDNLYPATTNLDIEQEEFTPLWYKTRAQVYANTFFVIGAVGNDPNNIGGGVNYYGLTPAQMIPLVRYLMSTTIYENLGFGTNGEPLTVLTAKALYNPIQYITSCFYFLVDYQDAYQTSVTDTIHIGPYDIGTGPGQFHQFTGHFFGHKAQWWDEQHIPLPSVHPQAPTRGKFVQYAPYTRYMLHYPPFGTIPIDPSYFEIGDDLYLQTFFDGVTGKGRLVVSAYHPPIGPLDPATITPISEHTALLGIPVQLNQISVDYLKAAVAVVDSAAGATSAVIGAGTNNPFMTGAGLTSAAHSIGNALHHLSPQLLSEGTNGSIISFNGKPKLVARYSILTDDDVADMGRPCCQQLMISVVGNSGSGNNYIKCSEVHIDFPCLDDEKPIINNYLLGGFFFEG